MLTSPHLRTLPWPVPRKQVDLLLTMQVDLLLTMQVDLLSLLLLVMQSASSRSRGLHSRPRSVCRGVSWVVLGLLLNLRLEEHVMSGKDGGSMRLQDLLPFGGRQCLVCKHLEQAQQALKTKEDKMTMARARRCGLRTPTKQSKGRFGTACLGLGS